MKKNIILGLVFIINLTLIFGATFNWDPIPDTYINISEEIRFSYDLNVTVDESLINFWFLNTADQSLNGTQRNTNTGFFTFVPSDEDVENYWGTYFIYVVQARNNTNPPFSYSDKVDHDFYFRILNVNDIPIISNTTPNQDITILELNNQNFTIKFYDIDPTNDDLNVKWYLDGNLEKNTDFNGFISKTNHTAWYNYITDYDSEGQHNLTVIITDEYGGEINYTWNIVVNDENRPVSISWYEPFTNFIEINETQSIYFKVNASDPDTNEIINISWFLNGGLIYLHSNTDSSSWNFTTDYSSAGIYNLSVRVTDGEFNAKHDWNISVLNVNLPPVINFFNASKYILEENELIRFYLNGYDFDNNLHKYKILINNTLLTTNSLISNNLTQNFSWIPSFSDSGVYNITLIINDTENLNDTLSFTITIINNTKPTINYFYNNSNIFENNTITFSFNALDINNNIKNYSIYKDGVLISFTNQSSQYFNFNSSGIYNISYKVCDDEGLYDLRSFLLNVSNVNLKPEIQNINYNSPINENEIIEINFTPYDYDLNIDFYGIYKNGILVNNSNKYFWKPNFSQSGIYEITLYVNDSEGLYENISFNIDIINNIKPNIFNPISYISRNEGENLSFGFNFNDSNNNINFYGIYLNNTLLNNSNYTNYYFDQVSAGNYNITYFINDTEGLFETFSFILLINETNFPPIINWTDSNSPVNEGEILNINFTAFDIDNNIANYSIYYKGSKVSSTNSYSWQTNFTNSGQNNFTLFVEDIYGLNDTLILPTYVIKNIKPNIISYINISSGIELTNIFFGFNANDSNNNIHTRIIYKNGLPIYGNHTTIYFDENSEGLHNITYFVNDTSGLSDYKTIFINITNTNQAPNILNYSTNSPINEGEVLRINFTAIDIDNNINSYGIYLNGLLMNLSNKLFWKTLFNDSGIHNVTLFVNDSFGLSDTLNITINVIDNVKPNIINYTNIIIISENSTINFNFTGTDINNNIANYSIYLNEILVSNNNIFIKYFNFTSNGNYTLRYVLTDIEGLNDTKEINFTVLDVNAYPRINFSSLNNHALNNSVVIEDNSRLFNLSKYVYDEDNYYSELNWSCEVLFNQTYISLNLNQITKILNISVFGNFTGNKSIYCNVTDILGGFDEDIFVINVVEGDNDPPIITSYTPTNFYINTSEDTSLNFTITAIDVEKTNLSYLWYLNDIFKVNGENASIYFNYLSSGINIVKINITDEGGASSLMYWTINVSDKNRVPIYGKEKNLFYEYSILISNTTNINKTNNEIKLELNSGNYINNGTFISNVIPFSVVDYKLSFNWTEIFNDNQTNIEVFYRTGPTINVGPNWIDWEKINNNNFTQKFNTTGSNFQYKIILRTINNSKTPVLTNFTIKYLIDDIQINRDSSLLNWIDLDDFFYDLDVDNTLNYYFSNNSNLILNINSINNYLSITPKPSFYGTEKINIVVSDGYSNVTSENITVIINNINNTLPVSSSSSSSGGGGSSSKKKVEIEYVNNSIIVPKQIIELNLPKPVKTNNTNMMKIPISLRNIYNYSLENITLFITSSNSTINLSETKIFIKKLNPNEEFKIDIEVSNYTKLTEFTLNVTAIDELYGFKDSGIIYIESLKNKTFAYEEINTKIKYSEEFLSMNNECQELREHINEAKELLNQKKYEDALLLIEKINDGCKSLLSNTKEFEFEKMVEEENNNKSEFQYYFKISIIILSLLLIYPIFKSILIVIRRHIDKKNKIHEDLNDYLKKLEK